MVTSPQVWSALKEVLDPEYPISVVDLGLIRGVGVDGDRVKVKLTFTSLGCPCVELIKEDIRRRLLELEGVRTVEVEEVFEPWSRKDISPEGLITLRRLGVV